MYDTNWCSSLQSQGSAEETYLEENRAFWAEFSDVDGSTSKGVSAGYSKAREAVFGVTPYLCYGSECITKDSEENRAIDRNMQDYMNDGNYDFNGYE
jgi:hypothetical protein